MRVLHVITRMIVGGAQENTLFNCLDLVRYHGDEVLLVTGPSLGAEGDLLACSNTEGLRVDVIPSLLRTIQLRKDRDAYIQLKKIIAQWHPDVVHTHSAKGGLLGRAAAWNCRVPCVIHTVHGAPFHPYQNSWSRRFFVACERWSAKRCHQMISVADAMTDLMVNAGVAKRDKFKTIYSGMDVEPFLRSGTDRVAVREELGVGEQDIVFGKIARLFHLKGHEYVIEAAKQVVSQLPNAKFLFVGDGILKERYEKDIEEANLSSHFLFTGLIPPSEIPRTISAMDVLVHTSLREGLARALPQALLSGVPAISFDVDGAREVVINEQTGCLVPPRDTQNLAMAMLKLGRSQSLRHSFGEEGRMRFTEQFRHQNMTRAIRDEYQKVLASRI